MSTPPVRGKNVETFRWDRRLQIQNLFMALNRALRWYVVALGQQYHVGEKPTFILYTYINRHAGTPNKTKTKYTMSLDYSSVCNIGYIVLHDVCLHTQTDCAKTISYAHQNKEKKSSTKRSEPQTALRWTTGSHSELTEPYGALRRRWTMGRRGIRGCCRERKSS